MNLPDELPCAILGTDAMGTITAANTELEVLTGIASADRIGRPMDALFPPAGRIFLQTHLWPTVLRDGRLREAKLHLLTAGGERLPVLVNCSRSTRDAGTVFTWVFFPVLERNRYEADLLVARQRAEQAAQDLAEQHELLRVTLQSIGDAVITTDAAARVTWLNPVAERLTGWTAAEAQGRPVAEIFRIIHEETRASAANPVEACLRSGQPGALADQAVLVARDGTEFGIQDSAAPIRTAQGDLLGAVLVFHDVSEQRRISGEMSWRASHDALTGLVNRSEFELRLLRLLRKVHEDDSGHALLYIDLDQFKQVNDACGHAVGDQLLQQVSRLLTDTIRSRDTLARLGGDEFSVLLEHCDVEQAHRVAQSVCDRMEVFRFTHGDRQFRVGASIGLVPVDRRWQTIAAIQQAADSSCYAAKEAGRNRVHTWFDTEANVQARQRDRQWTARIERALEASRFELFAQRIQPLRQQDRGLRAEILLRLPNGDGSHALPGAFLPAAERHDLASRIDRWVLHKTISWLAALPSLEEITCLSVNISGQSVADHTFHAWATPLLAEAGTAICSRLCLDITETAAVTSPSDARAFIAAVRATGVKVALDDFGTGASSFGYLRAMPIDCLKIDGQFVRDVVGDALDDVAVRSFTEVARVIGVQTVAESVEDAAVLARLIEIGVDFAQGHLIHRPEPLDQLHPGGASA